MPPSIHVWQGLTSPYIIVHFILRYFEVEVFARHPRDFVVSNLACDIEVSSSLVQ